MKIRALIGLASACMLMTSPAMAKGLSWDYVSLAWNLSGEFVDGSFSEDLEGYQFGFAKSLGDTVFLSASSDVNSMDDGLYIDFSAHQFGIGAHFPVSSGMDL